MIAFVRAVAAAAVVATAGGSYANAAFTAPLDAGMQAFYRRDFAAARASLERALAAVPDNALALAFLNAAAAHQPGALPALVAAEEAAAQARPHDYAAQLRLGFSLLVASRTGEDRSADARDAFAAALAARPESAAAHVGLGILRAGERSTTAAKTEFLAALQRDPNDVLAREYLATLYQVDLKDPARGLSYAMAVPNVVPYYADIDFHIASMLDDLHQYPAAIEYATRGLEIDVGRVGEAGHHGYTLLARIYLGEKRPADAKRVLRAAIAAGSDAEYAAVLLKKLPK